MAQTSKTILVTGATGQQGRQVIAAIYALPDNPFTVITLTRNPTSPAALALSQKHPSIKLLAGNLNDCPAIFASAATDLSHNDIWGVFSVQLPFGRGASFEIEERQGKDLIDASLAAGVKCFVYTSADRNGAQADTDPTDVRLYQTKYRIEQHLMTKFSGAGSTGWTILRPTTFMENITPGAFAKVFSALWMVALDPDRKLRLISCKDIGYFAAQAFLKPDEYRGARLSLTGDALTHGEARAVFKDVVGYDMPTTYGFVASFILWMMSDLGSMFRWINKYGYGDEGEVEELRRRYPGTETFRDFLGREENGWMGMKE